MNSNMTTDSHGSSPRARNPVVELVINLSTANAFIRAKLDEACSPFGLTGPQYNLLRVLQHSGKPELTHSDLVNMIVEKSVDVTRSVNNMIKLGFVMRRSHESDRRVALHSITDSGKNALREIDERFRGLLVAISEEFSPEELSNFSGLCGRLVSIDVPSPDTYHSPE